MRAYCGDGVPEQPPERTGSPTHPLIIAGAGLAGAALLFSAPSILLAVFGLSGSNSSAPEQTKEQKDIAFCKSVRESVKPGDKLCGKYLKRIDAELALEKYQAGFAEARRKEAAEQAAWEANNPNREISSIEMTACRMALQKAMRDPSSFRVNNETRAGGGQIDYTATNGFGGPDRQTFQCTTGQNIGGN